MLLIHLSPHLRGNPFGHEDESQLQAEEDEEEQKRRKEASQ